MKVYILLLMVVAWLVPLATSALAYLYDSATPNCSSYADGEFLPDRSSCARYYVCSGGRALRKFCARGLYFDAETGLCNMAYLVDCEINLFGGANIYYNVPSREATTAAPQVITAATISGGSSGGSAAFLTSFNDCERLVDGTVLLHPIHCRRYYVCTNKRTQRVVCPVGQWYDKSAKVCRPRSEVTNCAADRN